MASIVLLWFVPLARAKIKMFAHIPPSCDVWFAAQTAAGMRRALEAPLLAIILAIALLAPPPLAVLGRTTNVKIGKGAHTCQGDRSCPGLSWVRQLFMCGTILWTGAARREPAAVIVVEAHASWAPPHLRSVVLRTIYHPGHMCSPRSTIPTQGAC